MNSLLFRTVKFAALTVLAGTALMQAEQASFHLPVAAHWGEALLQPGDYKMSLPDASLGHPQFKIEGEGKRVYAFPVVADFTHASDSSHLELKQIDGEYFVCAFSSGVEGKEFRFYMPRHLGHLVAEKDIAKGVDSVTVSTN